MRPGVRIDGGATPGGADDPTSGPGPGSLFGQLAQVRGVGADPGGHVEVTLDGTGRLADVVVDDLVVQGGRRQVERAVREAFEAAFEALQAARQEQAQAMLASGQGRLTALTDRLQALSDHADSRLADALTRLQDQAERMSRGGGRT